MLHSQIAAEFQAFLKERSCLPVATDRCLCPSQPHQRESDHTSIAPLPTERYGLFEARPGRCGVAVGEVEKPKMAKRQRPPQPITDLLEEGETLLIARARLLILTLIARRPPQHPE
jgi:hypothetical protein